MNLGDRIHYWLRLRYRGTLPLLQWWINLVYFWECVLPCILRLDFKMTICCSCEEPIRGNRHSQRCWEKGMGYSGWGAR